MDGLRYNQRENSGYKASTLRDKGKAFKVGGIISKTSPILPKFGKTKQPFGQILGFVPFFDRTPPFLIKEGRFSFRYSLNKFTPFPDTSGDYQSIDDNIGPEGRVHLDPRRKIDDRTYLFHIA